MSSIGINGALYLASNALNAQRQAIEITGQNIANVNTPNYARQRANLVTSNTIQTSIGQEGTGVLVQGIEQMRNFLLDAQVPASVSSLSYYQERSSLMAQLQSGLEQPLDRLDSLASNTATTSGDGGLVQDLQNFFNAFQSLSSDPTSTSLRQQVILKAQAVASRLNTIGDGLISLQTQIGQTVSQSVSEANTSLASIASLNKQIAQIEVGGTGPRANDLRDQRQQLVEDLSKKFNIYTHEASDDTMTVRLGDSGGALLVSGVFSGNTASASTVKLTVDGSAPTMTLKSWTGGEAETSLNLDAIPGQPSTGSVAAELNMINTVIGDGTTGLVQTYDRIAAGLAGLVNGVHQTGFTLQNSPTYNTAGTATFFDNDSTAGNALGVVTARNIQLNSAVAADPLKIAASDAAGQPLNGNLAAALGNLTSNTTGTNLGGMTVSQYYLSQLTSLAGDIQATTSQQSTAQLVNQQLTQQRDSVQGVSLDEETSNLMLYQHAYQASARLMSVIDSMMQTILQIQ